MKRFVCAVRHRASGSVEALSSTEALPVVAALLAAAGVNAESVRASDVSKVAEQDGLFAAVVRPWVSGRPVPLGRFETRAAAIDSEVEYLSRELGLPGGENRT